MMKSVMYCAGRIDGLTGDHRTIGWATRVVLWFHPEGAQVHRAIYMIALSDALIGLNNATDATHQAAKTKVTDLASQMSYEDVQVAIRRANDELDAAETT